MISFLVSLIVGAVPGAETTSVTLVENGRAASVIVTADAPTDAARRGAEDLQYWLRRMSGAIVPIRSERDLARDATETMVLVGDTERTRGLGIDADRLGLEEVLIRTFPRTLVILGDDARPDGYTLTGTRIAVNVFVEDVLGVRLLWPGSLGEIVPARSTVTVQDVDLSAKPRLVDRVMDEHSFNGAIHLKLDALGWDRDAYHAFHDPSRRWFRFHRFGGSYQCSAGHAFDDYWKRFHAEHPDWFAQQPDGSRDNSQPDRGYPSHRLCISNPGLIRQVAADCIDRLKRRPTTDAVSVTPNDGGTQTFCLCPRCESWDAPEAPIVQMRSRNGRIPHVSLSDRFVRFYSAVAEIVAKELPERNIGALAYSLYHLPPVHAKLHPNVVLGFVPGTKIYVDDAAREEMRDTWLHWSRAADKLFVRPNFLLALHALPTVFVHRLGEDMRFFADNKLFFVGIDCNCHHWATNGLNYYVLTKLMWDPYRDVDAIVDEYCTTGFGPASKAVRGYFDAVEKLTHAIAAERKRPGSQVVARHYTDAALADLGKHLDEARRAAGVDQTILARIAFLRQGLDYAPISRDYMVAKDAAEDGDKWQWRSYTEQTVRRASWFQQLGPSHAIHVPWLIYWDW